MNNAITQEFIKKRISYDPDSGTFLRIWSSRRSDLVGKLAGRYTKLGYLYIDFGKKHYFAHRLAFVIMTGNFPVGEVDHINGDPRDNRWVNLRDITHKENQQNMHKVMSNSKTGVMGVRFYRGMYVAQIRFNDKRLHLGTFKTPQEAHKKYIEAKRILHTGCAI